MPTHRRLYVLNQSTTPRYVAVEAPYEALFIDTCLKKYPGLEFTKVEQELEALGVPKVGPEVINLWLPAEWHLLIAHLDNTHEAVQKVQPLKSTPLEIQKMLVVNISHLPYSAQNLLAQGVESRLHPKLVNPSSLIVDPIGEYGWRVCLDSEATSDFFTVSTLQLEQRGFTNEPRKALHDLIKFAQRHQCDWLAIDRDGPVIDDLPTYGD